MIIPLIGIVGVLFLAGAWIPQTIHTIREHGKVNITFNTLYIIGSGLLTTYSIFLGDYIFMALNGLAFLLAGLNLIYTVRIP
mgnify:FL=1